MAEDLISLTTEWNGCKLKKASNDPKLWYAEPECLRMLIEKAGAQRKTDVEVVAFIMSQIPAENKPVTSVLWVKPINERTLELVKKVYSKYWSAKFKVCGTIQGIGWKCSPIHTGWNEAWKLQEVQGQLFILQYSRTQAGRLL